MCKTLLKKISPRNMLFRVALICALALLFAYILQVFFGVLPCQMCRYERNILMVIMGVSIISLFLPIRYQRYAIIGLGFLFMGGALISAYHVAIQHHWVSLPAFCTSNDFSSFQSVEALREQMLKTPFVRCDQVTWSLFGLSLAGYNALFSLLFALVCWGWARVHK